MHRSHLLLCALAAAIAFALVALGVSVAVLIPALFCVVMMGAMVWMMVRMGSHGRDR